MTLKIRCKDERGEMKTGCGVRVILRIGEGTQHMRSGDKANVMEGEDALIARGLLAQSGRGWKER